MYVGIGLLFRVKNPTILRSCIEQNRLNQSEFTIHDCVITDENV